MAELQAQEGYNDADYNEGTRNSQGEAGYDSTWPQGGSQNRDSPGTTRDEGQGFVSRGRMRDRHVPPRDFPHPQPNDPQLAYSPVYGNSYPESSPWEFAQPANDLAVPEYNMPSAGTLASYYRNIGPAVDRSTYDEFQLPPSCLKRDPSSSSDTSQGACQDGAGEDNCT
jgi:hypothetical protein